MLNEPKMFAKMSESNKNILLKWINENLETRKTINMRWSSYRLKHVFEKSKNGFYITNGEFKGAMLMSGYTINDPNDINWYFNVSNQSRGLK